MSKRAVTVMWRWDATSRGGAAPDDALATLVDLARKGDRFAFEALVRKTWAGTYTLAYRLTGNVDDANDVAQDAYLRVLRGLPRFRGEARFSTWLYRVTANCAANYMTRASRNNHDELDDGLDTCALRDRRPEHNPESVAFRSDDRALVSAALMRLPATLRQVVVLRDVYDLPHKAIAAELGISVAAAKVRLQRARQRLREDISGSLGRGLAGTELAGCSVVMGDDDAVAS
ncbi:MAG: RNA polymerase sigma factor [Acidimicrobiales bacterium]